MLIDDRCFESRFVCEVANGCVSILRLQTLFVKLTHFFLASDFSTQQEGYDPRRSKVSEEKMDEWRSARIEGDLTEVPGIGPAAVAKLKDSDAGEDQITNTYQLFGKFLMLKGPGHDDEIMVEPFEHTQKFWQFLKNRGIASHRSAIVKAIAEKSATFFNGIYDEADYDDDDEE